MRNQPGSSLVGALLVLVVAGIIGGAGLRVYSAQQEAYKSPDDASGAADSSFAEQPRPLLTIDFSLDSKADHETGHMFIQYSLTEGGRAFDVRNVFNWAAQAGHQRELSKNVVAKIIDLLRGLPNPEEENIPKDWLVILTFRDGNDVRAHEYHRKRLPHTLKEVLELLGGIRFELRDTIGFSAAASQ